MDDDRLYVYALADRGLPRRLRVKGRALDVIAAGPLDAIVERHRPPPDVSEASLREQHAIVGELFRRRVALLPVRFGSLIDAADLARRVAAAEPALRAALAHVRGRAQMTVRVFGEPDAAPDVPRAPGTGAEYLTARLAQSRPPAATVAAIRDALGGLSVDEQVEGAKGHVRATVYHLVPETKLRAYLKAAETLRAALAPLRVTVTGPWPPFAFVPEL
jgi:hypothetical protein